MGGKGEILIQVKRFIFKKGIILFFVQEVVFGSKFEKQINKEKTSSSLFLLLKFRIYGIN